MTYLWIIFIIGALVYLGLCLFALLCAEKMIFPPPIATYKETDDIFFLKGKSGKIATLHMDVGAKYTIIYSHGNAEDLGIIYPVLCEFRNQGYNVIAYDYPGYGLSEGEPSEKGAYDAMDQVYNYLVSSKGVDSKYIVLYGRSLGGGPTYDLASRKEVGGVISEGTFSSAFRVKTKVSLVPWDCFNNLSKIRKIQCPLYLIHGKKDEVVPFSHGLQLYNASSQVNIKRSWVEDAGHNDIMDCMDSDYWLNVSDFIESLKRG